VRHYYFSFPVYASRKAQKADTCGIVVYQVSQKSYGITYILGVPGITVVKKQYYILVIQSEKTTFLDNSNYKQTILILILKLSNTHFIKKFQKLPRTKIFIQYNYEFEVE
jgi:hypothetical protein